MQPLSGRSVIHSLLARISRQETMSSRFTRFGTWMIKFATRRTLRSWNTRGVGLAGVLARLAIRAVLVVGAATSTAAASDPVIPLLPVESLSSKQLSLPADLPDVPCVFIVGFSKASSRPATEWSRRLQATLASDSVALYSVSVIEDVPRFLRGLLVSGIRRSVPASLHDRFLLVTQSASVWKDLTSYSEPDAAYVLLTNTAREVVWRAAGSPSDHKVAELVQQLSAVAVPAMRLRVGVR